ncbi:MAG: ATP-binding cassette domain-containing protein [Clostridia bacterium]|nr:ATP-binding cassette domain-containing protein [Clostridia bacterium]
MTDQKEVLLRVEDLCQYFGPTKAVDHVSFDIKKGEVFGLVGESGCGKTTTGRSIIKIYNITSGNIYFKGQRICAGNRSYKEAIKAARKEKATCKDEKRIEELNKIISDNYAEIRKAKFDHKYSDREYAQRLVKETHEKYQERQKHAMSPEEAEKLAKEYKDAIRVAKKTKLITKIQMIFQDPIASLDPRMTVREIISEGLAIRGIKDKEYIDNKVFEMLELVGLVREHAGRYPHEFSGGQRQRIGIARAIIMEPELLIADEPISALDVSIQAQVINLLNELRERLGLTILFIAHDLSVVKYFSDRIGVMYYGNMVELAETDELFDHPMHPYTRSLLSAIPLPDPRSEKKRVRIIYNPLASHDYSVDKPTLREILPGHFVRCNDAEEEKYKKEFGI